MEQTVTGRRGRKEVFTGDMQTGQRPDVALTGRLLDRDPEEIQIIDSPLTMDYAQQIAFMEEPVKIMIARSAEKYAPKYADARVNGKGAEVFRDGRWYELTYVPVGVPFITKRKYVEVWARAKPESIDAGETHQEGQDPVNFLNRTASAKHPISVIQDDNPMGYEWLSRIIAESY